MFCTASVDINTSGASAVLLPYAVEFFSSFRITTENFHKHTHTHTQNTHTHTKISPYDSNKFAIDFPQDI